LIPFLAQFTAAAADNQLMSKLLAESEGILVWAVRGCLDWQRSGLGMPVAIRKATDEYREESDPLAEYLSERCRLHSDASIAAAVLWEDYMGWCQENGELKHMERREFTRRLDSRGLRKVRKGHDRTWTWVGICRERDAAAEHLPVTAVVRSDADVKIQ
jgi:putative DNA primase/helicase